MNRKIDIGEDKNLFIPDTKLLLRPQATFLMDDLPKSADDTIQEARILVWPNWINSDPIVMGHVDELGKAYLFFISETVRGRVVMLNIWDYTLLPCRRSLVYVKEWHRRYHTAGFITVGVHAPMFEFGKDRKLVEDAIRDLGIAYPVVMDNNFDIWKSLENRCWPRRVLIDANGAICEDTVGEGNYVEFERSIQELLRETSPGLACPPLLKPLLSIDRDDFETPAVTPENFLGIKQNGQSGQHGRIGNAPGPLVVGEEAAFVDARSEYLPGTAYFGGGWVPGVESMRGTLLKSELTVSHLFTGTDVYIVACSRPRNPLDIPQLVKIQILIDRKPIADEQVGADAEITEMRRCIAVIRAPNVYHLVSRLENRQHELKLVIENAGTDTIELFALFFEHRE